MLLTALTISKASTLVLCAEAAAAGQEIHSSFWWASSSGFHILHAFGSLPAVL